MWYNKYLKYKMAEGFIVIIIFVTVMVGYMARSIFSKPTRVYP